MADSANTPPPDDEALLRARRRLLKAGLYAAPFIATFGVTRRAQAGFSTCTPQTCGPPCNPKVR